MKSEISQREKLNDVRKDFQGSLYLTCKNLLGFSDVNKETHGDVIELLEDPGTRKLICLPRGTLKSSVGVIGYAIWLLINNPDLRILITSELYTNSSTFLREIKSHIESPLFVKLFGNWKTKVWNESEIVIAPRSKKTKEASIRVAGIGVTTTGQHFDVIIADDLNSQDNTRSKEAAEKVVEHFKYNISILEPKGTYLVIGTRYHTNDVIGHILSNEETDYQEAA